jgi:hypothetical protein
LQGECPRPLQKAIRGVDVLLQHTKHIQAFTDDEKCILRISIGESRQEVTLSDGTRVHKGDPIGEIHLWNERIPQIPPEGPDLSWALAFQRQGVYSFRLLATYIEKSPEFDNICAFTGEISFGGAYDPAHSVVLARRWGFDVLNQDGSNRLFTHFGDFWENLYAMFLIWVFNPGSVENGKLWKMRRDQLWMSRQVLLGKYGSPRRGMGPADGTEEHTIQRLSWSSECR